MPHAVLALGKWVLTLGKYHNGLHHKKDVNDEIHWLNLAKPDDECRGAEDLLYVCDGEATDKIKNFPEKLWTAINLFLNKWMSKKCNFQIF